jgi:U3 small nucleolar RNA-associated protein 22
VEFRKFWGSKSELRRFEDTSICEAVYFEANEECAKKLIYAEIIKHIFKTYAIYFPSFVLFL